MLSNLLSALIVTLGVAVGVGVPLLAAHLETMNSRQREHDEALASQREVLLDYEAELDAYRPSPTGGSPRELSAR